MFAADAVLGQEIGHDAEAGGEDDLYHYFRQRGPALAEDDRIEVRKEAEHGGLLADVVHGTLRTGPSSGGENVAGVQACMADEIAPVASAMAPVPSPTASPMGRRWRPRAGREMTSSRSARVSSAYGA